MILSMPTALNKKYVYAYYDDKYLNAIHGHYTIVMSVCVCIWAIVRAVYPTLPGQSKTRAASVQEDRWCWSVVCSAFMFPVRSMTGRFSWYPTKLLCTCAFD